MTGQAPETGRPTGPDNLHGRRILVVEDTLLVAELISLNLEDWGFRVVGPVARVRKALDLLATGPVDGAMLDVNLNGESSFAVADALAALGTPFIFVTGYGVTGIPARYVTVPRLNKPFDMLEMSRLVAAIFGAPAPP